MSAERSDRRPTGRPPRAGKPVFSHLALMLIALVMLAPFVWMLLASFKPIEEVEMLSPLPSVWRADNYAKVFQQIPFARYYFNSFFVAAWVTFLTCLTSAMAAFAFARLRWRGRDSFFRLYLAHDSAGRQYALMLSSMADQRLLATMARLST